MTGTNIRPGNGLKARSKVKLHKRCPTFATFWPENLTVTLCHFGPWNSMDWWRATRRSCGNNQMQQRHALKPDAEFVILCFTLPAAAILQCLHFSGDIGSRMRCAGNNHVRNWTATNPWFGPETCFAQDRIESGIRGLATGTEVESEVAQPLQPEAPQILIGQPGRIRRLSKKTQDMDIYMDICQFSFWRLTAMLQDEFALDWLHDMMALISDQWASCILPHGSRPDYIMETAPIVQSRSWSLDIHKMWKIVEVFVSSWLRWYFGLANSSAHVTQHQFRGHANCRWRQNVARIVKQCS